MLAPFPRGSDDLLPAPSSDRKERANVSDEERCDWCGLPVAEGDEDQDTTTKLLHAEKCADEYWAYRAAEEAEMRMDDMRWAERHGEDFDNGD